MDRARKVGQNKENSAPGPVTENMGEHDTAISRNIKVRTTSSTGKVIKVKSDLSRLVPYIKPYVALFPGPALQQLSFLERERGGGLSGAGARPCSPQPPTLSSGQSDKVQRVLPPPSPESRA